MVSTAVLLEKNGVIALRPSDVLHDPQLLLNLWMEEALPLELYSESEIELQQRINSQTADQIVTYSPENEERFWNTVDVEEITPYTWKWVDLEMKKNDGTLTTISLRRPNKWIRQVQADRIGNEVYLEIHEAGIEGWATVKNIRVNQLDTRMWKEDRTGDYITRPITGKFTHQRASVYDVYLEGNKKPLGITENHPVWSINRGGWVKAAHLNSGEIVKTYERKTKITYLEKRDGSQTVYNLEVFRDHNFFVSLNSVLVHNMCWDEGWQSLQDEDRSVMAVNGHKLYQSSGLFKDGEVRYLIDGIKYQQEADLSSIVKGLKETARTTPRAIRGPAVNGISIRFRYKGRNDLEWFKVMQKNNRTFEGLHVDVDEKAGFIELSGRLNK